MGRAGGRFSLGFLRTARESVLEPVFSCPVLLGQTLNPEKGPVSAIHLVVSGCSREGHACIYCTMVFVDFDYSMVCWVHEDIILCIYGWTAKLAHGDLVYEF